jgi:phosphoglycerol transferase
MDSLGRPWLRFIGYALGFFLFACVRWITNSFGNPTIQQILYHLHFLPDLLSQPDRIFVVTFTVECVLAPLLLAGALCFIERVLSSHIRGAESFRRTASPTVRRSVRYAYVFLPHIVLISGVIIFGYRYSLLSYLASRVGEDRFAQLYVDPRNVRLHRTAPVKNLVLIYIESLEDTYRDKAIFGVNLLDRLDALPGVSFDYRPAPGTGWTIGAIVGTQCGIPLQFVTQMDDLETGEHVRSFLPGAVCLPDILHGYGYRNVFLGSASLSYAGKGKFLRSHHYDQAFGYEEWRKIRESVHGWNVWGIYDDDLFAFAKEKLVELHQSAVPFNLTLLTVDTHNPGGFYSRSCRAEGPSQFQTIIRCVSGEAADLVNFIRDRGFLADTNIVIIGDHLAMPNPVYSKLLSSPHRKIFNKFISASPFEKSSDEIIPFDLFPTLLEFVGIQVDGQRLALGRSGIFHGSVWPQGPRQESSADVLNFSRKYEGLWTDLTTKPDGAR